MNFNKIHELKSNNLFKIFLLMSLFLIYKSHKKIAIILLVLVGLFYLICSTEEFEKVLENIDTGKLRFGHYVDVIKLEEMSYKILNKAKKDRKILETINKKAIEITRDEWQCVMDVNLTGTYFMSTSFGRMLINQDRHGSIISLGSTHGTVGFSGASTYGIAKAGIAAILPKI